MPSATLRLPAFLRCFLQRSPENIACRLDAFFVGVRVHLERNALVRVSEFFGHRRHIRVVCDGDAGKRVPELVRVKMLDTVLFTELLK